VVNDRPFAASLIERAKRDADARVAAIQQDMSGKLVLDPDEVVRLTADAPSGAPKVVYAVR
jgi:hypothetical protein